MVMPCASLGAPVADKESVVSDFIVEYNSEFKKRLYKDHPDIMAIADRGNPEEIRAFKENVRNWIATKPKEEADRLAYIYMKGNAKEVSQLFTQYKLENGIKNVLSEPKEHIAPVDDQRKILLDSEYSFKRHNYWTSSILQTKKEPFYTLTTRATSIESGYNYDIAIALHGENCNRINTLISVDGNIFDEEMINEAGIMLFDGTIEYNFMYSTQNGNRDLILFSYGDVNDMIRLMKKSHVVVVELPALQKRILYDLLGFSAALTRSKKMCQASR